MGIYSPQTNLPVGSRKGQFCPSGRPTSRPANGQFSDRCACGRPPGRPAPTREWGTVSRSTARSTGPKPLVDRPPPESGVLSVGRPAESAGLCARPVHIGRPWRSTNSWSGRPDQSSLTGIKGYWKLVFLISIKSHKSHKFHKNKFL